MTATTSNKANVSQNDGGIHKAIDLDFAEMAEQEISAALTPIRAAITLRENNAHLDRDATLELTLQACRHVANAAEHLPPVNEEEEAMSW
jgi:hypothetical protein